MTEPSVQPRTEEVGTPSSVSEKSGDAPFDQLAPFLPRRSTVVVEVEPVSQLRVMRPLVSVAVSFPTLAVALPARSGADAPSAQGASSAQAAATHAETIALIPRETRAPACLFQVRLTVPGYHFP